MAIAFSKYVDITSGVGGGRGVRQRELILRLFTENPLIPTNSFVEMTTLEDVGYYFGTGSDEYKRASVYFGFVSKNITSPKKISFARFARIAVAATIYGGKTVVPVSTFAGIDDGSIVFELGGVTATIENIDFTEVENYGDIAAVMQVALSDEFAGIQVDYDSINRRFNFLSTISGNLTISARAATSGTSIIGLINWIEGVDPIANARFSDGLEAQSYVDCVSQSADISNNFGSFEFMPYYVVGEEAILKYMTLANALTVATWNNAQNVKYIFLLAVFRADYPTFSESLIEIGGTALTEVADVLVDYQYTEMIPSFIQAATAYDRRNSVQNYMYQIVDGMTPTVDATMSSNALDAARINYYGVTQQAGQYLAFYQRGNLCGGSTDPIDMGVYSNEAWLKDKIGASIMSLFLALGYIPANDAGRAKIITQIQQDGVQPALFNGTISVGKPFNTTQKQYIDNITGVENSWRDVQGKGYWLDCEIVATVVDDVTEFSAEYTLIYSKNDSIRRVVGTHILI